MELKLSKRYELIELSLGSNRTFMELKCGNGSCRFKVAEF